LAEHTPPTYTERDPEFLIDICLERRTHRFRALCELAMKILCLLVLAAAILQPVYAQETNSEIESKIIAMEKAWNQAFKYRDAKAVDALLDEKVVLVNDDGSLLSKSAFLAIIREAKASDEEQVTPESIAVHVVSGVAIATGVFRAKGVEGGKPYVRHNRFVDTWVNKNGTWVCISASATPVLH
jgi:ketosteroid isomerase-like protein